MSHHRQRPPPPVQPAPPPYRQPQNPTSAPTRQQQEEEEVFNIIPVHNLLADHPSLRYPEVRAAAAALRAVGDLRRPPFSPWLPHYDLLDWLALFFGFQSSNVKNQREHLVLHLSNAQMRLSPPPDNIDSLDPTVLRRFQKQLLKNYSSWCSFLRLKSNVWLSDSNCVLLWLGKGREGHSMCGPHQLWKEINQIEKEALHARGKHWSCEVDALNGLQKWSFVHFS